ncbi:unnamed protein product [Discula destructiva]
MIWQARLSALLAVGAQAGGIGDLIAEGYLSGRSPQSLEARTADSELKHDVASRQLAPTVQLDVNGTANMAAWDAQVNAACTAALSKLSQATNPSGTCTCYNLPVLNNATGAFEADLRLYQISAARDDFAGIPANQVQVSLSYNGASVSPVSASTASTKVAARQASTVQLLQTYLFIGQIDADRLRGGMNIAELEAVVMPTVTLSAVNAVGRTVSTNVSSNEAAFLKGVFSNEISWSTTAVAQIAVDQVKAGLSNGTIAFILPGVNLLVFPIGLVITGSWCLIGFAVIGFGFFERVQYRESYRRRVAIAAKGPTMKRI